MNQGKLEVVKQEMARVNIDILGISELKWTGMEEFNSDDHYIYSCGQESLRRNGYLLLARLILVYYLDVGLYPWRRKWQPITILLPVKSHGQRSLVDYSPWDLKELDMTERLHFTAFHTLFLTMISTPFLLRDSFPQ